MWVENLFHVLPVEHGAEAEAYVTIGLLGIGIFVSIGAGILVAGRVRRTNLAPHAPAFVVGALLFLFFDLMKEAASLGQPIVREPLTLVSLLAAFAVGVMFIPVLVENGKPLPAWAWATAIALHTAGEGWIVGTEATSTTIPVLGTLSFLLHKTLEGFTIPIVVGVTLGTNAVGRLSLLVAGVGVVTALLGQFSGPGFVPLLFFAAGAGALAYGATFLVPRPIASRASAVALFAGILAVYLAGILHEL